MTIELDHIFVCTSVDGKEADRLIAFGLSEGAPNLHPGQGTACRRFFFANSYIELLWVNDVAEAQSTPIQPTRLWERWSERISGSCPFGFAFRPATQVDVEPPFQSWNYAPPYLPPPRCIRVAANSNMLHEPMLIYLPFREPANQANAKRPVLSQPAGFQNITRVAFLSPHQDRISTALNAVTSMGLIQLRPGSEYLVELGFDMEAQGQVLDFRPSLPLVFRW